MNWRRNSLINCQCGASLLPAHQLTTPASKAELLVSRLIWQKLFGLFEPKTHSLSFLANLELDTSLRLIWSFGQVEQDGHTVAVRPGKVPSTATAGQVVRRGVERIHRALNHKKCGDNFTSSIYINSIKQLKEDTPWSDQLKINYLINLIAEKDIRASKLSSFTIQLQHLLFGDENDKKKLPPKNCSTRH